MTTMPSFFRSFFIFLNDPLSRLCTLHIPLSKEHNIVWTAYHNTDGLAVPTTVFKKNKQLTDIRNVKY